MTRALQHSSRAGLLAAALLVVAFALATPAVGAEPIYGGLGSVGSLTSGKEGKHGQISPEGKRAFAVDSKTGDFFVADEFATSESGKQQSFARIQEFSSTGQFLAENRVELQQEGGVAVEHVGGLAVDANAPSGERVYLLLVLTRPSVNVSVEKELAEVEHKIELKKKEIEKAEAKKEPTLTLEKEEKELVEKQEKLEGEEEPLDKEDPAASGLWSFSTVALGEKLKEATHITKSAELQPTSEVAKTALLFPSGIAVDPVTHDVVIVGQQDDSATIGNEELHAAVQRIHESGALGPRYVDQENCLDNAATVLSEPDCETSDKEEPSSPIVSPGGRVYVQEGGEEIWEVPASEKDTEGFKEIASEPKHLYSLEGGLVFNGVAHEGEGGSMAFVPGTAPGAGRIYLDALIPGGEKQKALLALEYSEPSGQPSVKEIGWTGGQTGSSSQQQCVIPFEKRTTPVLLGGGSGEQALLLTTLNAKVIAFGPDGEGCGHEPVVTAPSVKVGGSPTDASEVALGEPVELGSSVTGAHAKSVVWKFKYSNAETGESGEEKVEPGYDLQTATALTHSFQHEGEYEIVEIVNTDSFAYPTVTATVVKITVTGIKIHFAAFGQVRAAQEATIRAKIEDLAESPAHLKAEWNFGDGSTPVTETEHEGSPWTVEAKHTFAKPGEYTIKLEAKDASGVRHLLATAKLPVGESVAEEDLRLQHEREATERHELEVKEQLEAAAKRKQEEEAAAAAKKRQEEEAAAAAKKRQEEEAAKAKSKVPLTRAQLLAKALKTCKKEPKHKRAKCEATARKKYGSKAKKKKK